MLMIARYVSYHPIIAIMYSPEAIIRPDQNNTKPPATTQIFRENEGKLLVTPTHLPSLFPPESLRSRLLSWISMKGNCYFCNKLYRWCSEVKGKYICGNIFTMFRNLQRVHWLQCLGGDPSRLAKINWLLDSGNRFTSRPSLTTSETLINGQWSDNNIFQILIFNKCAIFGVMWFSWSSLVSPWVRVLNLQFLCKYRNGSSGPRLGGISQLKFSSPAQNGNEVCWKRSADILIVARSHSSTLDFNQSFRGFGFWK